MALAACGSSASGGDKSSSSASVGSSNVKVGLVLDEAGLGDKSFNDSADAGAKKAQQGTGVSVKELTPKKGGTDRAELLALLASRRDRPGHRRRLRVRGRAEVGGAEVPQDQLRYR